MPGPAPKPGAIRPRLGSDSSRGSFTQFTALPAEGRSGRVPGWPLSKMVAGEKTVWADVWRTPQAVQWERLGYTRTVARYVRLLVQVEQPGAQAALLAQTAQLEDRLGLNPKAMQTLRWRIVDDEVTEKRDKGKPASRRRLKAVASGTG